MNKNIFDKIIKNVIVMIKDNKSILKKLNKQDKKFYNFELDIEKLIEIIKNIQISEQSANNKKILVSFLGNPYITMLLCLEAIKNECSLTLDINDVCYGINKGIVELVNTSLKDLKINNSINICNCILSKDIRKNSFDKIVCLGDNNSYTVFRKLSDVEVVYIPLFNIKLYYDDEKYEKLVRQIYYYSTDNFFEIEIFDNEEDFEEVVYVINSSHEKHCSVLLSKDKQKQEIFKNSIKEGMIFINENPFKKFEYKLPENIF